MIEMISGVYGAKGRLIRPADGAFSLTPAEEERLVGRGVARYVGTFSAPEPSEPAPAESDPEEIEDSENGDEPEPGPEPPKSSKPKRNVKPKEEAPPELAVEDPVE